MVRNDAAISYGGETVLVADDDPIVRDMLYNLLTEFGYSVILASNGQEAVDKYKQHGSTIHLVLSDIVMPNKDGVSVYKEIKEMQPDAVILLMSGYYDPKTFNIAEGMQVIPKPFSIDMLIRTIRSSLDKECNVYET